MNTKDSSNAKRRPCECGCGQLAPLYKNTNKTTGAVAGEPARFIKGHNNSQRSVTKNHRYVEEDRGYKTPCHIWQLTPAKNGYGTIQRSVNGKKTSRHAHRVFFERANGPIPKGYEPDHLCRVRICVNAEHMEVVTRAENTRRGSRAKLTMEKAGEIRALYRDTRITQKALAKRFGVGENTIYAVLRNITWRHS